MNHPCRGFPSPSIFPSARQAILSAIPDRSAGERAFVAIARHSSHCLRIIASQRGLLLPLDCLSQEQLQPVAAALVYEQWGWPVNRSVWHRLAELVPRAVIIADRVDSADFLERSLARESKSGRLVEVLSLSKTLGLDGGGLAVRGGELLRFDPEPGSPGAERLARTLAEPTTPIRPAHREYFKNSHQLVIPTVRSWTAENNLEHALAAEANDRRQNVRIVQQTAWASDWPPWMHAAIQAGAAPNIAPVLRGKEGAVLRTIVCLLAKRWGIQTNISLFDWAGNPFQPRFEPCLALPVHGDVTRLAEVLADSA